MQELHPISNRPATPVQPDNRRPRSKAEAARQFEEVLVRQFVKTMTDGLFKTSLAGEDGPGWMEGYQQTQRDVLTDELTRHLVERGALHLSDQLLRQWGRTRPDQEISTTREDSGNV